MMRRMLRAKIHRVRITATYLDYEGSLGIARELMEASGILPWEEVYVANVTTGERFTTYAFETPPKTGVALYGAAARLGAVDDLAIVMTYAGVDDANAASHRPVVVRMEDDGITMRGL
ncbi:aspartate 1-decarboxylase [Candidatus Fermentibacteria bacterium]|nr:aspartate 1-decarboxylase [Candidatus Fermentibacteria bacterium]